MPFVPGSTDGPRPTSAGEPVLLAAERAVTVTREEHHQDVLAGRSGQVVAGLRPCTIGAGKYAGECGVEVVLDGRRVGELTRQMSRRYLPLIDAVTSRGRSAACEAQLRRDHRGVQVELRLPAVDTDTRPAGEPPTLPVPVPRAAPTPTRVLPPAAPPAAAGPPWPVPPPYLPPHPVAPPPAVPSARTPLAPAGRPRPHRARRAAWSVAAVVGVLTVIAAIGNGGRTGAPVATARSAPASTTVPATRAAVPTGTATVPAADATTATPTSTPTATSTTRRPAVAASPPRVPAVRTPATRTPAVAAPPTQTTATRPAPRTATSAPAPARPAPGPGAAPEQTAGSGCDPNYSPCVPIASDVDCEGGSGNGPAYVKGPVRIIGKDIYGLDGGGKPGVGCEN